MDPLAHLNGNDPEGLLARIDGVWAGRDLQEQFHAEVAKLLSRKPKSFPGAQPVSFSKRHLEVLKQHDYYVCEKTDGMRYLLWMTEDEGRPIHYLIDRKNDYYYVSDLYFPHQDSKDFTTAHNHTILDGELVEDHYPNGTSEIKFYVFDCLVLDDQNLMIRPLDKRLAYFKARVLEPYNKMFKTQPDRPRAFKLQDKQNEFSYAMEKMFKEIIPKVKQLHGNDGLIFTCKDTNYCSGTDPHILKWKPPEENTVDFLLHITWATSPPDPTDPDQSLIEDYEAVPEHFGLYVNYGNDNYQPHGTLYVAPDEWERFKAMKRPLQDAIVECYLEDDAGHHTNGNGNGNGSTNGVNGSTRKRWRFHRFRDDKVEANHISTYESVIDSIEDHITEDDLMRNAAEVRANWKARLAGKEQPK